MHDHLLAVIFRANLETQRKRRRLPRFCEAACQWYEPGLFVAIAATAQCNGKHGGGAQFPHVPMYLQAARGHSLRHPTEGRFTADLLICSTTENARRWRPFVSQRPVAGGRERLLSGLPVATVLLSGFAIWLWHPCADVYVS